MIDRKFNIALVAALGLTLAACATTKEEPVAQPAEPQAAAPAPAPTAVPTAAPTNMISYEVRRGDHLWGIAGQPRIYGNPYAWPLIYKSNTAKIKDADLIYPGQNFDINRDASASDMNAAVRHAKTRGEWSLGATEQSDKDYLAGRR